MLKVTGSQSGKREGDMCTRVFFPVLYSFAAFHEHPNDLDGKLSVNEVAALLACLSDVDSERTLHSRHGNRKQQTSPGLAAWDSGVLVRFVGEGATGSYR